MIKLRFSDYHTHSHLCNHAIGTLEEYVQAGIGKNLFELGLSDHFPMHLLPKEYQMNAMSLDYLDQYINESQTLKEKYKDKIGIKVAVEVDYYPSLFKPYKKAVDSIKDSLDYILGSVHFISSDLTEEPFLTMDRAHIDPELSPTIIDQIFVEYYTIIQKLIDTNYFTVLSHFDLPKKYGLRTNSELVEDIIFDIIDAIEKRNMVVEINTSGLRSPIGEPFPSDSILKELINRSIPLTLGSDAHQPKDVAYNFSIIYKKLRRLGAKEITRIENFDLYFDKIS